MPLYPVQFVKEAYSELKKVNWLSRQQVVASTLLVVLIVCLVALYVGVVDFLLSIFLRAFLGG